MFILILLDVPHRLLHLSHDYISFLRTSVSPPSRTAPALGTQYDHPVGSHGENYIVQMATGRSCETSFLNGEIAAKGRIAPNSFGKFDAASWFWKQCSFHGVRRQVVCDDFQNHSFQSCCLRSTSRKGSAGSELKRSFGTVLHKRRRTSRSMACQGKFTNGQGQEAKKIPFRVLRNDL